jgi:outer membrane protein OmpA-like peptidoglycan-associated protein
MQDKVSEKQPPKKKLIRRAWFWMLVGLAIVGVLFVILLPLGIDYKIENYLKDQGADQVSLEDVDFNPITGRMLLENLNVVIGSQTVLSIPEAMLDLEWEPFINKRFVLKRVAISDTELTVKDLEEGRWQVGGINLPDTGETAKPSAWNFGLQQVTVKNSIIKFVSSQLTSELKVEQATISKVSSWLPKQRARLELKGQLNDSNLQLEVDVSPFANQILTAGAIQLKGLSSKPFARLLEPHLKSFEGRLDADLNFETGQTAEENLIINVDGKLNSSNLSTIIKNANIQIQQDNIDWQGKIDYVQTATATDLNLNGALSVQNANVTGPEINLSEELLNWKGVFTFSTSKSDAAQNISSEGELSTGPLALRLPQQKLDIEHAGLKWQGKFDYAQNKAKKNINADGQIHLDAAKLKSPELNLVEEKLSWKGEFQFSAPAESAGRRIITDGTLDGGHLQVDLPGRKLKYDHRGLSWTGRLDTGETKDFSGLTAEGGIALTDIRILHTESNRRLLNSDRLKLQAIRVEGLNEIRISDITAAGLALLVDSEVGSPAADPPPLRLKEVNSKDVRISQQQQMTIDAIQLNTVKAFVHRNPEGKLPAIEIWHTIQKDMLAAGRRANRATSDASAKEKSDAFKFRIGRVEISRGSEIQIKDESVSPAFSMDLSILQARVTELDSSRPEQPASVTLLLSNKDNARLSLDGTMMLFAEKISLDWIGKIEALELPPLSPYVIRSTGYRFTSGELEADIPLKIAQNELDGKIDLTIYNPKIQRERIKDPENEQPGKIQLNMTLDSALRLMRDKQNNVKLNIPISGNINDPQFSIADAVNTVLAKTLGTAAVSYLKYMLGPYGIGISVAQLAYQQALKIRLNPILFDPGSSELNEAATDYLQRVAQIMKEYPTVQVVVCGFATESDRAALGASPSTADGNQPADQVKNSRDEDSARKKTATQAITDVTLLELAKNRTQRIEDQLVNRHEIAAKRIIDCNPSIDGNAKAQPRADLEI